MVGISTAAIPASLRRANERTLLGALMRLGEASRAELAKVAGLSQPTIGKITSELLELGVLLEDDESALPNGVEEAAPKVGRPGRRLRLNDEQQRFLAIELDVAETRLAALPLRMREDNWTHRFATPDSPQAWQAQLARTIKKLSLHGLWGTLISVPGIVDEKAGRVLFSPNLHWSEKVSLPELVQQVVKLPALMIQEIRALALGHLATHPEAQNFLLVDFGQGVGGAIVKQGKLYDNPLPLCGELGHTPVAGNQRLCGCGARGCVETLVSRPGLLRSLAEARHAHRSPSWAELVAEIEQHGMPAWLADSLEAAATVIAGALNVLGLRQVVLPGHLVELPPAVIEYLSRAIERGAMWARFGEVLCTAAPRHRAAGLAVMGMDRLLVPVSHQEGLRSLKARA
ncbi:MAG: ROK family protein [Verrucomicrobiae bacterium]|nr:ROK family protein [Verrucomicrobiae bacterium]